MLHSLSTKLLLAALLSVLCAAAAYLAVFGIGTLFVNRYYMSPNSVAARKAEIYTEFNRFVQEGGYASGDTEALQRFLAEHDHISVSVYSAEMLELPSGPTPGARAMTLQSYEAPRRSGISGRLYPMRFSDGISYISITDNSREREDTLNRIMGLVVPSGREIWTGRSRWTVWTRSRRWLRTSTACGMRLLNAWETRSAPGKPTAS